MDFNSSCRRSWRSRIQLKYFSEKLMSQNLRYFRGTRFSLLSTARYQVSCYYITSDLGNNQ